MKTQVTFKHEDETDGGMPFGPVNVVDVAAHAEWSAANPGPFVPFGVTPGGVTELGWKTLAEARRIARQHGVELEEF